jgi:hypothetical protein
MRMRVNASNCRITFKHLHVYARGANESRGTRSITRHVINCLFLVQERGPYTDALKDLPAVTERSDFNAYVSLGRHHELQASLLECEHHLLRNPAWAFVRNHRVRLLASLCGELQEMVIDRPFMPCHMSFAKLFGHSSHRTTSNWIKALKVLEILRIAEPWKQGKVTRYFYIS